MSQGKHVKNSKGKHVPARWRDFTNIGCVVKGTR